MECDIAGDANRDRVTERGHLADGKPRDFSEKPVHGLASPKAAPRNCRMASNCLRELCGSTKLIIRQIRQPRDR
jgi:hypothetical protein